MKTTLRMLIAGMVAYNIAFIGKIVSELETQAEHAVAGISERTYGMFEVEELFSQRAEECIQKTGDIRLQEIVASVDQDLLRPLNRNGKYLLYTFGISDFYEENITYWNAPGAYFWAANIGVENLYDAADIIQQLETRTAQLCPELREDTSQLCTCG